MVAVLEMSVWHVARWARCVAQVYLCVCVCLPPALCVCPFCVCVCVCVCVRARALLCLHRQAYLSCGSVCLLRLQWVCVHITPMSRGCCPLQVGVCSQQLASVAGWEVGSELLRGWALPGVNYRASDTARPQAAAA